MSRIALLKSMMMFLSRWILLSSLFLFGCAGATMFVSATGGGIVSKYLGESIGNIDFKEAEPVDVKIVRLLSGEESVSYTHLTLPTILLV